MRQGNILNENIIDCDRYQPKQCSCRRKLHMKNCCKNDKNSSHIRFDRWTKFILVFFILFIVFDNVNAESKRWSIEELQTLTFPYMTTNDLYMDACKAGGYIDDIALTHSEVAQLKKINDTLKKLGREIETLGKGEFDSAESQSGVEKHKRHHHHHHHHNHHAHAKKRKNAQKKFRMVYNRGQNRQRRAATGRPERVWEHGVIPYEIQANFSGEHHALFRRAMNHWENNTCISFIPRTPDDESYIVFTIAECGCCSFVGKRGEGPQAISIGKNCDKFGIVVHELGHVVGFWHEHTRPDRDQYVDIFYRNIQQGQDYNFEKLKPAEVNSMGQLYDYASIMHYARDTFSRAMYLDTILPKPDIFTNERPEIGQRIRLSPGDIIQTKMLYRCPKCGQTFLETKGSLSSPTFDNKLEYSGEREPIFCQWRMVAPHGHRIQLNVTSFNIPESPNCSGDDYLEVRDGHYLKSPLIGRYCGNQGVTTVTTNSNRLWIEYKGTSFNLERVVKPSPGGVIEQTQNANGFLANFEVLCGGEMTADNGIIENTNYPYEYPPNSNCVWVITVPDDYQVAVIFTLFQLEVHDECIYDYLEFRDGDQNSSDLIGKFCGFNMPPNIKSSGNKLRVKFASDASVEKAGFSLKFIKEFDECKTPNHGCHHKCINTLGGYRCECDIGYELHADGKSCEHACGGYLKGENGSLTSPNFPGVYPHKKRCVWEIEAHPQYRITLNFTHFDLEGVHTNCEYDYLKVISVDAQGNVAKVHGTYCGKQLPVFLLTSETSHLRLEFSTDSSVAKSGFAAVYFTDRDECDVDNGGCEQICKNVIGSYKCECESGYLLAADGHHCKEGGCKFELNAPSGQVVSPNYPEEYPNKKECIWHFVATPGHRLQMDFVEFEIEPHQECAYDRLEFYDGSSATSLTLGRYCGLKAPQKILTSKNELFMVFRSDSSVQRKGFNAHYSTVCGGTLQAERSIGLLYSHASYGGVNYDNKMSCDWTILARDGMAVGIRFMNFELEEEYHCDYDYLEIFDGEDEQGTRLIRTCGSRLPLAYVSTGSALRLQFRSDDTVGAKGFLVEYFATEPVDGSAYMTPVPGSTTRPPLEPVINERIKSQFVKTKAVKNS